MAHKLQSFAQAGYYRLWSCYLSQQILGMYFEKAVSFDKDTLFIHFRNESRAYTLEVKFIDGYLFLFSSDRTAAVKDNRKGILQFRQLESLPITSIINNPNDRYIAIELGDSKIFWLKGFGKFGNVLLCDKETQCVEQIFKLGFKSDWDFQIPALDTDFFIQQSIFNEKQLVEFEQLQIDFGQTLRAYFFENTKEKLLKDLQSKIKHLKNIIEQSEKRIEQIETRRSNKELGDLILAHAHSLKPGLSQALITDYYTQQRIRIKLNPELSAAENAKKYYGKAKNEIIERKKLEQTLTISTENLQKLELQQAKIISSSDMKELRKSLPANTNHGDRLNKTKQDNLPYKLVEFQGYQIWIGKNNKSNEELLKLSSKHDLWLHAKDATGSHVIIRKKGLNYPKEVIEFAANLAAQNSKSKHQSIVPVIFTERKYISKSKNMNAGEVNVLKEQIIDAHLIK